MKKILIVAALAGTLGGCATYSPDVVQPYQAQRMSVVQDATVLSVRPVSIDGRQTGVGTVAGSVVGGVAGSSIGGYRDGFVGGVIGAVVGGVIGNAVERDATRQDGVEILVQLRNGERRAIVQGRGAETLAVGEPVMLVTSGARTRVMRAPAVAPGVAPAAAPVGTPVPAAQS